MLVFLGIEINVFFKNVVTQNVWTVFKIAGPQIDGYSNFKSCGLSNYGIIKICGYSKFIDIQNLWVLKYVGAQNLWLLKICDETKFQVDGKENPNIYFLCI